MPFNRPRSSLLIFRTLLCVLALFEVVARALAVDLNPQEQQIFNSLKFTNGQGRPFVVLDPILCQVARQKAADMGHRGYYSHTTPDGHGPNWLVRQAGYTLPDYYDQSAAGNNIESVNAGRASAGDAWSSWLDSGAHRQHLLGENSFYAQQTSVGVGFADVPGSQWRYYWVVITAPPSGPGISIKTPKAGQEINGSSLNVSGSTNGKPVATRVEVRLENSSGIGEWVTAAGTTSWSIDLTGAQPGSNTIRARSLAGDETVLDEASRNFRFVLLAPLTVQIEGRGSVTKGFAGVSDREVGRTYRLTATPAAGALFAGWSGGLTTPSPAVKFVMSEEFNLAATFVENPFLGGRASYTGLTATSTGSPALLSLTLNGLGRFSGKLKLPGFTIPIRGAFDPLGKAVFSSSYKGQSFSVDLTYELTGGVPAISGTITGPEWTIPVNLTASTNAPDAGATGRYTVVLRADPEASEEVPRGDGFGLARISRKGRTVFSGTLADGTPFLASGLLSRDKTLPVFLAPYAKSGLLAGPLRFQNSGEVDGQFSWVRPANAKSPRFPKGFTTTNIAVGAHYTPPPPGEPVVRVAASLNNAQLELGDGGFANPVLQLATIEPDNSVIVSTPAVPGLSLGINRLTGQFHGRFIHPNTGTEAVFRGVVVQKENAGFGFFIANGSSGYATLAPTAEPAE